MKTGRGTACEWLEIQNWKSNPALPYGQISAWCFTLVMFEFPDEVVTHACYQCFATDNVWWSWNSSISPHTRWTQCPSPATCPRFHFRLWGFVKWGSSMQSQSQLLKVCAIKSFFDGQIRSWIIICTGNPTRSSESWPVPALNIMQFCSTRHDDTKFFHFFKSLMTQARESPAVHVWIV